MYKLEIDYMDEHDNKINGLEFKCNSKEEVLTITKSFMNNYKIIRIKWEKQ